MLSKYMRNTLIVSFLLACTMPSYSLPGPLTASEAAEISPHLPIDTVTDTGSNGILYARMIDNKDINVTWGHINSGVVTSRTTRGHIKSQSFYRHGLYTVEELSIIFDKGEVASSVIAKAYTGTHINADYIAGKRMLLLTNNLVNGLTAYAECKRSICPSGIRVFDVIDMAGNTKGYKIDFDGNNSQVLFASERGGAKFAGVAQSAYCKFSFTTNWTVEEFACSPHHNADLLNQYYHMLADNSLLEDEISGWNINESVEFLEPDLHTSFGPRFKITLPGDSNGVFRKDILGGLRDLVFYTNIPFDAKVNQQLLKASKVR